MKTDAAYVLHARPYRESSAILDVLTRDHGRLALVARGQRKRGGPALVPFVRNTIGFTGRRELKNLVRIEAERSAWLTGEVLTAGLYVNELLIRLLHREAPVEGIFDAYDTLVGDLLAASQLPELALRAFEKRLLDELGYGFSFEVDAGSGDRIDPTGRYRFDAQQGFVAVSTASESSYSGEVVLAVASGRFERPEVRRCAREVMRAALGVHLGGRELVSRRLWSPGSAPRAGNVPP